MTRIHENDHGAVLVIVAVCLLALVGMVVLVVDVGGLLVRKRQMVMTSDSAALASAQECAQNHTFVDAQREAGEVAAANVEEAVGKISILTGACGGVSSGTVLARYRAGQKLYFAPILGMDKAMSVSSPAKAIWGPAGQGAAVPLMVSATQIRDKCMGLPVPPNTPPGKRCGFWYDSDDIGSANWGWMNLDRWAVGKTDHCNAVGSSVHENWIQNNFPSPLRLNWTAPTYVCADTGNREANWKDVEGIVGQTRIFPVNDGDGTSSLALGGPVGHGQIDKNGDPCPPVAEAADGCTLDKYDVIGFTVFKLIALYDGNSVEAIGTPGTPSIPGGAGTCDDKNNGQLKAGDIFAVYQLAGPGCPSPLIPDTVIPKVVPGPFVYTQQNNNSPKIAKTRCLLPTQTTGCDYYYDPVAFEVTWRGANTSNVFFSFDWAKAGVPGVAGTAGACGENGNPPSPDLTAKHQDKCLLVEWQGFQSGGLDPGRGPDLGLRAIRLSE